MIDRMQNQLQFLSQNNPLIHCITNPISMNDCANAVLALGARPIMAEHPEEVAEITALARAVVLNLGNISQVRMESMQIAGEIAKGRQIPCIIDLVGVACSVLRLNYAKKLVESSQPCVIKGNLSELKAFCGEKSSAVGIDVGENDKFSEKNQENIIMMLKKFSIQTNAIVVATGAVDIITDGSKIALVENGCNMLSEITGTGCMLGMIIACFLSAEATFDGTVNAVSYFGICGELAQTQKGTGSFRVSLMDWLSMVTIQQLEERRRVHELKE